MTKPATVHRQAPQLSSPLFSPLSSDPSPEKLDPDQQSNQLLNAMIEALADGILMITSEGKLLHANRCALGFCRQLNPSQSRPGQIPAQIWRICESLIDSRAIFPDQIIVLEDEVCSQTGATIRIRVQWIEVETVAHPCLLVTLEDRHQSAKISAIAEAQRYHLTQRETEVWLLRRAGYHYEGIAAQLFISINTVKKHLKSIYAKRSQQSDNHVQIS